MVLSINHALAKDKPKEKHSSLAENSIVIDPFEDWNRNVFAFNNTLDQYLLRPVAETYDFITPKTVRLLVKNELDYIQSPISIANSMLQGDIDIILHTSGRFLINTFFGGIGLLDAASDFGLKPHREDFGQTLSVWGVSDGGYYVAPILGSLTLRDLAGKITDFAFAPTTYVGDNIIYATATASGLEVIEFRANNAELIDNLKKASPDYYATIKTVYIQKRNADIKNATFLPEDKQESEFINFDD